MANIAWKFWQETFKLLVDRGDGTHAERVEAYPPAKLMTDSDGSYSRLRVDPGQTSFWAGKEFRTFQEFSIPALSMVTVRATVGVDIVLHSTSINVDSGTVMMSLFAGGTANGPWTSMPVLRKNNMSSAPVRSANVIMDYDGGHTGGTKLDTTIVSAGKTSSVGAEESSERGVPAGVYYYRIENLGNQAATCVFSGWWEERV